jgi:hypothetical protein
MKLKPFDPTKPELACFADGTPCRVLCTDLSPDTGCPVAYVTKTGYPRTATLKGEAAPGESFVLFTRPEEYSVWFWLEEGEAHYAYFRPRDITHPSLHQHTWSE